MPTVLTHPMKKGKASDSLDWFYIPHLLAGETQESYDRFVEKFSAEIKPQGAIEVAFTSDFIQHCYELRRYRRYRDLILKQATPAGLQMLLLQITSREKAYETVVKSLGGDATAKKEVSFVLNSLEVTMEAAAAKALDMNMSSIVQIEALIDKVERRRDAALAKLEFRREALGAMAKMVGPKAEMAAHG